MYGRKKQTNHITTAIAPESNVRKQCSDSRNSCLELLIRKEKNKTFKTAFFELPLKRSVQTIIKPNNRF